MHTPTFPKEMAQLPNWLDWRLEPDKKTGRDMKVPYNPKTGYRASTANKNSWGTLDEVLAAKEKYNFTGIGFVFDDESGIIDLDKCLINAFDKLYHGEWHGKYPSHPENAPLKMDR